MVAQLVRAPPCHGGGREFESRPSRNMSITERPWEITTFLGFPIWARPLQDNNPPVELDFKDVVGGSMPIGLISLPQTFDLPSQTVSVLASKNRKPVVVFTSGGKSETLVGHSVIRAADIHGITRRGRHVRIV